MTGPVPEQKLFRIPDAVIVDANENIGEPGLRIDVVEASAVASEVARREGIHSSQLFRRRRQLCGSPKMRPDISMLAVVPAPASNGPSAPSSEIEIVWTSGTRIGIGGSADRATVSAATTALAQAQRRR